MTGLRGGRGCGCAGSTPTRCRASWWGWSPPGGSSMGCCAAWWSFGTTPAGPRGVTPPSGTWTTPPRMPPAGPPAMATPRGCVSAATRSRRTPGWAHTATPESLTVTTPTGHTYRRATLPLTQPRGRPPGRPPIRRPGRAPGPGRRRRARPVSTGITRPRGLRRAVRRHAHSWHPAAPSRAGRTHSGMAVTKSMSSSIRPRSAGSRSR